VVTVTALCADRDVVERLLVRLAEGVAEGVSCPVGDVRSDRLSNVLAVSLTRGR